MKDFERIIKGTATLKLNNLKSKRLLNHATVHKSGSKSNEK